jgi:hypothetical protein
MRPRERALRASPATRSSPPRCSDLTCHLACRKRASRAVRQEKTQARASRALSRAPIRPHDAHSLAGASQT